MDPRRGILVLAALAIASAATARPDREDAVIVKPSEYLELPGRLSADPQDGYHGMYDIKVVGLRYTVQVYYWMVPGENHFYFKSKGTGVDIPWCGPYTYELKDNGDGTSDIIETGADPHCGEKETKAHPIKDLKRTYDNNSNQIVMSMQVYTVWPVGWKQILANCEACTDPECIMP